MKQKVLLVASHLGRMGTSATVGLLGQAGAQVGKPENLPAANIMNPKGYFELKNFTRLLHKAFGKYYGVNLKKTPTYDFLDAAALMHHRTFDDMIDFEFDEGTIVMKSQRHLTIPFFNLLRDKYDVRVFVMHRNLEDQVQSIKRMWKNSNYHQESSATLEHIRKSIVRWEKFCRDLRSHYKFDYFDLPFEKLIADPENVFRQMCLFAGLGKLPKSIASNWIDKKLVNRKNI